MKFLRAHSHDVGQATLSNAQLVLTSGLGRVPPSLAADGFPLFRMKVSWSQVRQEGRARQTGKISLSMSIMIIHCSTSQSKPTNRSKEAPFGFEGRTN